MHSPSLPCVRGGGTACRDGVVVRNVGVVRSVGVVILSVSEESQKESQKPATRPFTTFRVTGQMSF